MVSSCSSLQINARPTKPLPPFDLRTRTRTETLDRDNKVSVTTWCCSPGLLKYFLYSCFLFRSCRRTVLTRRLWVLNKLRDSAEKLGRLLCCRRDFSYIRYSKDEMEQKHKHTSWMTNPSSHIFVYWTSFCALFHAVALKRKNYDHYFMFEVIKKDKRDSGRK